MGNAPIQYLPWQGSASLVGHERKSTTPTLKG